VDLDAAWDNGGVGRGMGVLYGWVLLEVERAILGLSLGHAVTTNGDFVMQLFPN